MKLNKMGFTMAELLIVVAIVGILVAVSIPIFNKQLEKAREAHDIATMRSAASAAIELYYAGVKDEATAAAAGMSWWRGTNQNAAGVYVPKSSGFVPKREDLPEDSKAYGKGTKVDAGTGFVLGNDRGAYAPGEDYTDAVCMVSIYPPTASSGGRVEVYWKHNTGTSAPYVGGQQATSIPKYSITIPLH